MNDLLAVADELYGLPAGDFIGARDALIREAKADKDRVAELKALRKPSLAAWVLNQLVRRESAEVGQLLDVGAALREAAGSLDAAAMRELTKQRRQVTAAVTTTSRRVARGLGVKVTEAVATQVEAMLTAAMLDERVSQAVRSGLLVATVTPAEADSVVSVVALPSALGFAASAVEEHEAGPPTLTVVQGDKARTEAEAELTEAGAALAAAQEAVARAQAAVADLEAEELRVGAELDEARRRVAALESESEDVEGRLAEAVEARDEAVEDEAAAASRRTAAQEALDRLS